MICSIYWFAAVGSERAGRLPAVAQSFFGCKIKITFISAIGSQTSGPTVVLPVSRHVIWP